MSAVIEGNTWKETSFTWNSWPHKIDQLQLCNYMYAPNNICYKYNVCTCHLNQVVKYAAIQIPSSAVNVQNNRLYLTSQVNVEVSR